MAAPFIVLLTTEMPAILAEVSSVSNEDEAQLLTKPLYRQYIAEALAKGYEQAVRGWCLATARRGSFKRGQLWRQFQHGVSPKCFAFAIAGMLGSPGLNAWQRGSGALRRSASFLSHG